MKKIHIAIGIIISAFFLTLSLKGINWKQVGATLLHAQYIFLIPAILLHFISFYVRAFKWSLIVSKFKKVTADQLFPLITIGLAMNNILPLRAGEIGRIIMLSNKFKISKINAGISLILERLFDIIGLLIVILIFIHFRKWPSYVNILINASSLAIVICIICIPLLLVGLDKAFAHKLFDKFKKTKISFIFDKLKEIKKGYLIYHDVRVVSLLVVFSIVLWLIEGLSYYTLSYVFHIPISLPDFIFVCAIVNMSSALPSTSGFIGTFEFFLIGLLSFLGLSRSIGLSYDLILHAEVLVPVTLVGIYFYFSSKYYNFMSLTQIKQIENE